MIEDKDKLPFLKSRIESCIEAIREERNKKWNDYGYGCSNINEGKLLAYQNILNMIEWIA